MSENTKETAELAVPAALVADKVEISTGPEGLTLDEVAAAKAAGNVNITKQSSSRSIGQIIRANVFTVFNAILSVALVIVLIVGSWPDAVFGIVMVVNSLTGIIAELRAKQMLDSLSLIGQEKIKVRRGGVVSEIPVSEIVLGDRLIVGLGDQIPADCRVVSVSGLQLDESMLTGESRPQRKAVGDEAFSGAAVVAGSGELVAVAVGANAYIQRLGKEVKRFSKAHSELAEGIDKILVWVARGLPVVIVVLLWSQLHESGGLAAAWASGAWRQAVVLAIAGVVGMIPQGLVLLTSVNFATAALVLARKGVLVQELPAVEILARVTTICLDKTGTLTTGGISFREFDTLDEKSLPPGVNAANCRAALAALAADRTNATAVAIADGIQTNSDTNFTAGTRIPFNSARKWSAIGGPEIAGKQSWWVMGAPEILARSCRNGEATLAAAQPHVDHGRRVIALAYTTTPIAEDDPQLAADATLVAIVVLEEQLRPDAAQTLKYFADQNVTVKVISGDNPRTVAALGARLGINGGKPRWIDAAELPAIGTPEFAEQIANHDVFGRVTPEQKQAMVSALQSRGEVVAMTGDGVNDALALKRADLGIAMGSGTAATKAAAKVVLMDGKFSHLPAVVGEGRRVLANMERVASLFLAKTSYALLIALAVSVALMPYPFLPRQLTIIGSLSIGIPAFFLALAPSKQRYRAGFLRRTLMLAIPSGALIGAAALTSYFLMGGGRAASTVTTLVTLICALVLLATVSRPLFSWRGGLLLTMVGAAIVILAIPFTRKFFALSLPTWDAWILVAVISLITGAILLAYGAYWNRTFRHQSESETK